MPTQKVIQQEGFLFSGQSVNDVEDGNEQANLDSWKVLIVDDEPEIHQVTTMALSGVKIAGKALSFLHAYSAEEAYKALQTEEKVAVVILDVVMESDDSGLIACQRIREELGLIDVRIILRTGQPGYAPEEQVIMQYDINDYRTKTELTRNKLLTSIFSAIRSYSQIVEIRNSRNFLNNLNSLNTDLLSQSDLLSFVECLGKKVA